MFEDHERKAKQSRLKHWFTNIKKQAKETLETADAIAETKIQERKKRGKKQ